MAPRKDKSAGQTEPEIPPPDVSVPKTLKWIGVVNARSLNPFETMMASNTEVIASQLSKVIEMLETLHIKASPRSTGGSSRGTSRRSSAASNMSLDSEHQEAGGDEGDFTASQEDVEVETRIITHYQETLYEQYATWLEESHSRPYVTTTKKATEAAVVFKKHLMRMAFPVLYDEDWSSHELKGLLERVSDSCWVRVFLKLGKVHKEKDKGKGKATAKPKDDGKDDDDDDDDDDDEGPHTGRRRSVQTLSASQQTVRQEHPIEARGGGGDHDADAGQNDSGDEEYRPEEEEERGVLQEEDDDEQGQGNLQSFDLRGQIPAGGTITITSPHRPKAPKKRVTSSLFTPMGKQGSGSGLGAGAGAGTATPTGSGSASKSKKLGNTPVMSPSGSAGSLKRTARQRGSASGGEGVKRSRKGLTIEDDDVEDDSPSESAVVGTDSEAMVE